MIYDLLLKDALVPIGGNDVVQASIIVSEGKIVKLVKDYTPYLDKVEYTLRCRGLIAVPGGIDIHAHIYDPDYTHHEDFETGTIAAAYGGITTVFDMPLRMYVDNAAALSKKVDEGLAKSFINFGIHGGMINEDNLGCIKELIGLGVRSFKIFTCKPFRPRSDEGIVRAIEVVSSENALPFIHAEDDALIDYLTSKFRSEGRNDPLTHHESRPSEAEALAIRRVCDIARFLGVRIHIAHVSSALGALEVKRAKELGNNVTAETCPQYLYFTREDVRRLGNYLKMNPSLKTRDDVKELWKYLASGVIDAVASDHAPSTREEKEVNVWDAWGGIPSIEVMFPLVFTIGFKRLGVLTLERYVEVTSKNPARIMGLYPRKGSLMPGSDADIAVLDPDTYFKVRSDRLHHKVDWTPYEGLELCGWPKHVIVNGKVIIEAGVLIRENRLAKYVSS